MTVLCGTNSAGKSTILKALLLLRQTLGIREAVGIATPKLRFVGSQVDLGNYRSFISHNQTWRDLTIGLTIDGSLPAAIMDQLTSNDPVTPVDSVMLTSSDEREYQLRALFTFGLTLTSESDDSEEEAQIVSPEFSNATPTKERQAQLKSIEFSMLGGQKELLSWSLTADSSHYEMPVKPAYTLHFKRHFLTKVGGLEGLSQGEDLFGEVVFLTILRGSLPDRIVAKQQKKESDDSDVGEDYWRAFPMPPLLERATRDLRKALTNIQYLGPLRSAAKRYYTAQIDPDPVLDPAGEFLPYILRDRGEMPVWNLRRNQQNPVRESLIQALNYWLGYLRTGTDEVDVEEELSVETLQDILVQLAIRSVAGVETHALADSGFGYSQVLPILARGLLAPPGTTVIIEQPEVHLNPALQVRVAEFLVSMSIARKQILVETHSEHIVNAVRVLAAEDATGRLSNLCRILYIENVDDICNIHDLSIQPDGSVPQWPRHFFGEAADLTGRLLRAQKLKGASR